jgi:small subunit ribosomal protein S2
LSATSMRQLLEAGVHFGHQTRRWNPKMRPYIYGERNGIYIIDLEQTTRALERAYEFVRKAASEKKNIVFVGTKKQASEIVEEEAKRCGAFFVNRRWLGGMLTNFETIRLRINRLKELDEMKSTGDFYRRPKKELTVLNREMYKLERSLGGIKGMRGRPDVLFIVDQKRELIAVSEAKKMDISVVGIIDTNCDPDDIDFVIPGNDDSIRSIKLIVGKIADAVLEGKQGQAYPGLEEEKAALSLTEAAVLETDDQVELVLGEQAAELDQEQLEEVLAKSSTEDNGEIPVILPELVIAADKDTIQEYEDAYLDSED